MSHCPQCNRCPTCGQPRGVDHADKLQKDMRLVNNRMKVLQNKQNKTKDDDREETEPQGGRWDKILERRVNEQEEAARERILINRKPNSRKR